MTRRLVMILGLALCGCGGQSASDAGAPDAGGPDASALADGGADSSVEPSDAGEPDAGACPGGCDDGVACTLDRCEASGCLHEPRHRLCGAGMFCVPSEGCTSGAVCTDDVDCGSAADRCVRNLHCSIATRQCTWDLLDGDGDGEPPAICGGADCDDSEPDVGPAGVEQCNGLDDDCDGEVDGPAASAGCSDGGSCVMGACECSAGRSDCGAGLGCRDLDSDPLACGSCSTACRDGESCVSGTCECAPGHVICDSTCVDTSTDPAHCGGCGVACASGASCVAGACGCPAGTTDCSLACRSLGTDPRSCGACDVVCLDGSACVTGTCSSRVSLRGWQADSFSLHRSGSLSAHPSGEVTHGFTFDRRFDELPFRGIAISPAVRRHFYLSRRAASGSERWSRILAPSVASPSFGLSGNVSQEDVWVAGTYRGDLDFGAGVVSVGGWSVAVTRFRGADGVPTWVRTFTPTAGGALDSAVRMTDFAVGASGQVALLLYIEDPTSFGGAALSGRVVVTLDASGTHLGSWTLPTALQATEVEVAPDGSVVVAGEYSGGAPMVGSTTLPPAGTYPGTFVVRFSSSGVPSSVLGFVDPATSVRLQAIGVATDGDLLLGVGDDLVARLAPDGTPRWTFSGGPRSGPYARAHRVRLMPSGNLLVYGSQFGGFDFGAGPLTEVRFFAELRPDGTFVRSRGIEALYTSPPADLWAATPDRWVATGEFVSSIRFQDQTLSVTDATRRGVYYVELQP